MTAQSLAASRTVATFGEAYRSGLTAILDEGEWIAGVRESSSVGSSFGRAPRRTLEIVAHAIHVLDASGLIVTSAARRSRLSASIGLWAWTLAGSEEVDSIDYYNPRARSFSDDGLRLRGALGPRFFGTAPAEQASQLEVAIRRLQADPSSRRAVVSILAPSDLVGDTRDVPCSIAVQYLVRNGRLEALTYMRSQSAALVLIYDIFVFAALQRFVAARLGLEAGAHHLFAGSYHLYEDEVALATRIAAEPVASVAMAPMKATDEATARLLRSERELRQLSRRDDIRQLRAQALANLDDGSFEWQATSVLAAFALGRLGKVADARAILNELPPQLAEVALVEWEG